MSKGYLYDNGNELITREDALPESSAEDSGKVLTVGSDGTPDWSDVPPVDVKMILTISGSGTNWKYSFYNLDGQSIKGKNVLELANNKGCVLAILNGIGNTTNPLFFAGDVIRLKVTESGSNVNIAIPTTARFTSDSGVNYIDKMDLETFTVSKEASTTGNSAYYSKFVLTPAT